MKYIRVNYEGQKFFTFFTHLGLDPDSFLLEFFMRQHTSERLGFILGPQEIRSHYLSNHHRFRSPHNGQTNVSPYEFNVLRKIYDVINNNITFNWLYEKNEKSLNILRFLRNLFFFATMPFFGKKYRNLIYYDFNEKAKEKQINKLKKKNKFKIL